MMKSAILASLIAAAAAFAPSKSSVSTTSTQLAGVDFSKEVGVQAPLGFFDPLGLLFDADQAKFDRLRLVEVKHGRIAMLAVVGYLTTDAGIRFPGAEGIPGGFAALESGAIPELVWAQFVATVALMEMVNQDAGIAAKGEPMGEFPGDFRNGALDFGWDKQSDAWKRNKRTIELNNGRAAQMGILGIMVHEQLGNIPEVLPGH
ncbi:Fucoxanthin-chlorophyll a-c binding protein A, chloroplastic [Seminavis robusta]|uniref:Fucoxanthin-chlorophyll a-c binding protein A, chloroplastic n=1 Tax=Seminavis robusta TaxID=568900 RepID=A0A9N8DC60_9STRA|nr:Fucoxanthin-chlorophyll a-c binding protein A, chloroplastic [Seminavis robusta]|eukprot:Sro31_g020150.1 Fucoxanthin-chlorophyll a-c binding protein A, chloroplastic (204) ;mRNA; f:52249-52860